MDNKVLLDQRSEKAVHGGTVEDHKSVKDAYGMEKGGKADLMVSLRGFWPGRRWWCRC